MRGSSTSVEGDRSSPCLEADDRYLLPCNKILDQALTRVCPCANSGTGIKGTRIPANGHVVLRRAQEVEQTIMASRKAQASMKHHTFTTLALLVALALSGQTTAQETQQDRKPRHQKYQLIDLGTFGGPQGGFAPSGNGGPYINNGGDAVATAQTPIPLPPNSPCLAPNVSHALRWHSGQITDLGALSPSDQNCSSALGINGKGEIAGQSENGVIDPLLGVIESRAVMWRGGKIFDLGTFGGNHSNAGSINDRGQVAGWALNDIPDPLSIYGVFFFGSANSTQTRGFLWQNGKKRDLGTLGGPDTFAGSVNARGQVSGGSYTNSIPSPPFGLATIDPFLWENGRMIDVGTLGGNFGLPTAPNNRGQLAGSSDLAGDAAFHPFFWDRTTLTDLGTLGGTNGAANALNDAGEVVGQADLSNDDAYHAFHWKNGTMKDLGALPGYPCSSAFAINSSSQIVGISSDCGSFLAASLWEDGDLVALDDLVSPRSDVILIEPQVISDQGVIGVNGLPPGCYNSDICGHPYLLVPIGDCDEDNEARIAARHSRQATAILGGSGGHPMIGRDTSPIERVRSLFLRSFHPHSSRARS
jgi:probable HAF family extracellular repeat protein